MSWSRFDDGYTQHPKIVALGEFYEVGIALDVAAIGWCNRNTTDGRLPKANVWFLVRCAGMRIGRVAVTAQAVAERLVAVGRWEDAGDHYVIHDFLDYNPSRAEVYAKRNATAARVQRHRNARRNGVTGETVTAAETPPKRDSTPWPEPEPVPSSSLASLEKTRPAPRAAAPPRGQEARDPRIAVVLEHFCARHQSALGAPYVIQGGRDGKLLRALPQAFSAEAICAFVDVFFARPDDWTADKTGFTIPRFVARLPALQAQHAGMRRGDDFDGIRQWLASEADALPDAPAALALPLEGRRR